MVGSSDLIHPPHFTGGMIKVLCLWQYPELVLEAKGSPVGVDTTQSTSSVSAGASSGST